MAYTIEQIEDAIIDAVEAIDAVTIRTVKTYQGELEEKDIRRLTAQFPAVYVVYGGSDYAAHGDRKIERMVYHLIVCDKSLRIEEEARRGGAGNPGTYAMLHAVRDALCGSQAGLSNLTPMALISETPVWFGDGLSIYAAEYGAAQAHLYTGA